MRDFIFFDFAGTLIKMRPAKLLANRNLIERLSKKYALGIITGAKKAETLNILKKLAIEKLFELVITASDTKRRKPDPKLFPKTRIVAYVGDTNKDKIFAQKGKIPFFLVNKRYSINMIIRRFML